MDFSQIVSSTSLASWHIPAAWHHSDRYADPKFLGSIKQAFGNFDKAAKGWLGLFIDSSHNFLIHDERFHQPNKWYFGLLHFDNSAVVGWPGSIEKFAFDIYHWVPDKTLDKGSCFPLVDLDDKIKIIEVTWRSPMWLRTQLPMNSDTTLSRVLVQAHVKSKADKGEKLQVVAAKNAFWTLPLSFIRRVGSELGIDMPAHALELKKGVVLTFAHGHDL